MLLEILESKVSYGSCCKGFGDSLGDIGQKVQLVQIETVSAVL